MTRWPALAAAIVLAPALAVFAAASPEAPRGDEQLLPAEGVVPGWQPAGPPRVYAGPELYQLIDGGAEIFFEQGFERVTTRRYALAGDVIGIELYAMVDATAALGIYLARCGDETPAPGLELRHTAGRYELLAVQGRYYIAVEDLSGRAERAADLVIFARALAGRLPPPEPVTALALLPEAGRVSGSVRLIRGPLALQPFVLLGEGDVLQLAGRVTAAAAAYRDPAGRFTLVVAPYADGDTAGRVFAGVQQKLDPGITPITRTPSRLVFRDYAGRYGDISLKEARIELRLGLAERP